MSTTLKIKTLYLFLTFFFLGANSAYAAPFGLSINPPLLRVQIKPSKSITQVFTITNLGNTDKILVARIIPFSESDKQGNPNINLKAQAPWQKYFSLANSFIKLDEPFTLRANTSDQLILSITVPDTAILQDLYATLLVSTYNNEINSTFQGSVVNATIGSNLLVTVSSELNPTTLLKIENFTPATGTYIKIGRTYFADNITPLTFSATVKNDGNYTSETKGLFRLATANNTPVYLDGVLPVYVISKNSRLLLNSDGKDFKYTPTLTQIGSFQSSIEIKSDNSNTKSSIDIIFVPFKVTLGLLISLLILSAIIRTTRIKSNRLT